MTLYRISDRYPTYRNAYFNGNDVKGMTVRSAENARVGTVTDIFIDGENHIQFLVVDIGESQVLMPIRGCASNFEQNTVYARSLNQSEFKNLQPYSETDELHNRPELSAEQTTVIEDSATIEGTALTNLVPAQTSEEPATTPSFTEDTPFSKEQSVQLYEERLVTQKQRIKTGEVKISKKTITETTNIGIPIVREKVIIEIESIYSGQTRIDFGDAEASEDGTVRMGIYEEQTEVCRRIVPYQNVSIRKEVVQDTVHTQQTVRKEELDIQSEGNPEIVQTDTISRLA